MAAWSFTPRVWGWFESRGLYANDEGVYPTGVGMVRPSAYAGNVPGGLPHGCGDGSLYLNG